MRRSANTSMSCVRTFSWRLASSSLSWMPKRSRRMRGDERVAAGAGHRAPAIDARPPGGARGLPRQEARQPLGDEPRLAGALRADDGDQLRRLVLDGARENAVELRELGLASDEGHGYAMRRRHRRAALRAGGSALGPVTVRGGSDTGREFTRLRRSDMLRGEVRLIATFIGRHCGRLARSLWGCGRSIRGPTSARRPAATRRPAFFVTRHVAELFRQVRLRHERLPRRGDGPRLLPPAGRQRRDAPPDPNRRCRPGPTQWQANFRAVEQNLTCSSPTGSAVLAIPSGRGQPHPPGDIVTDHAGRRRALHDVAQVTGIMPRATVMVIALVRRRFASSRSPSTAQAKADPQLRVIVPRAPVRTGPGLQLSRALSRRARRGVAGRRSQRQLLVPRHPARRALRLDLRRAGAAVRGRPRRIEGVARVGARSRARCSRPRRSPRRTWA